MASETANVNTETNSSPTKEPEETNGADRGDSAMDINDKTRTQEAPGTLVALQPEGESESEKSEETNSTPKELVNFKIVYNKQKHDITFPLDETVQNLKEHLTSVTGVPSAMQKIMYKGRMKDEATLRDQKVTEGSKIMLVGSTVSDVMSVTAPDPKVLKEEEKKEAAAGKEPLCSLKPHKTVLDKYGKPDDAMIGVKNKKENLPPVPVAGMYNKSGGKVRLTFKLEADQLWIGTKERTDKIPMGSIKAVVSEPITGHEDYHLMALQLGPTEASRYWIYWVPAQYVDAIKDAVLGKWQFF